MSDRVSNRFMFAGPSFCGEERLTAEAGGMMRVLPPVRRGDVESLVSAHPPGVLVLVDGNFHQCLSVGHAEIRAAIEAGWSVWGLSSMGAIRAYEMRHLGMKGYGRVYRCFYEHEDFRDDEVALVHEPVPPYHAVSEPLVHIRFFLRELVSRRLLTEPSERAILETFMSLWFGDRTLPLLRSILLETTPRHEEEVADLLANFRRFRVKCRDLADFLRERPWGASRRAGYEERPVNRSSSTTRESPNR
ncbi:MAG TPA: TfuA-like protein [Pyrinomonadaceae bacterium]